LIFQKIFPQPFQAKNHRLDYSENILWPCGTLFLITPEYSLGEDYAAATVKMKDTAFSRARAPSFQKSIVFIEPWRRSSYPS
jgi:hypothetical protein